jgi:hypothetical protein
MMIIKLHSLALTFSWSNACKRNVWNQRINLGQQCTWHCWQYGEGILCLDSPTLAITWVLHALAMNFFFPKLPVLFFGPLPCSVDCWVMAWWENWWKTRIYFLILRFLRSWVVLVSWVAFFYVFLTSKQKCYEILIWEYIFLFINRIIRKR